MVARTRRGCALALAGMLGLLSAATFAARREAIDFQPCAADETLQCGSLQVPLDYEDRASARIPLSVIRAPATDTDKRIGVLFVNPGGPGASGLEVVLGGVRTPIGGRLREYFDIVSFDTRGSNESAAIRCDIGAAFDPGAARPAELPRLFDEFAAKIAAACRQQNGAIVTSMSTNNTARDIDTLRRALGEKQITYVGMSFGTELGAVYASMFPQQVRHVLLDAGVPPEFGDSYVEFVEEQTVAMERVLHHIDVLCRSDAACPLASSGVVAAVDTLIARLDAKPVSAPEGQMLTGDTIRDVVAFRLYSERTWPGLLTGLAAALHGEYRYFAKVAPHVGAFIKRATTTRVFEAYDAVLCNDFSTRRTGAEAIELDRTSAAAYPRFFGRHFMAGELMRCAGWPRAQPPVIRDVGERLAGRILLIGNDFDPATPLSWTRSLARALGVDSSIVRYLGGGHGVTTTGLPCIDDLVVDYLVNGTMPPTGTTCAARPMQFATTE